MSASKSSRIAVSVTLISALALVSAPLLAETAAVSWQQNLTQARQARTGNDWDAAGAYYDLALRQAEAFPEADQRLARTLEEVSRFYAQRKDRDRALALQTRAVDLRTATGESSTLTAESIYRLGKLYQQFGAAEEAEPLVRRALEMREALAGAGGSTLGVMLRDLSALVQELRPDDEEAEALLLRNVDIDETSRSRALLAEYYGARERHDDAVEQYLRAIELEQGRQGPDLRHLVRLQTHLANQYRALDRTEEAERRLIEALELRESHLGSRHPYVAFSLRELADLYADMERYHDAEDALNRAREINAAAWGESSDRCSCNTDELLARIQQGLSGQTAPRVLETDEPAGARATEPEEAQAGDVLEQRVASLRKTGELDAALQAASRALELAGQTHGETSLEYAEGLDRIGQLLREQRDYAAAFDVYARRLAVLEASLEFDDPRLAPALHTLGALARTLDRFADAEQYLLRENELRQALGQNYRSVRVLESLGGIGLEDGQPARAEYHYAWAVDVWEEFAGPDNPEAVRLNVALARSLLAQDKHVEAEALLVGLMEREQGKPLLDTSATIQILQGLKSLYLATDRDAEAQAADARITELRRMHQTRPAQRSAASRRAAAAD